MRSRIQSNALGVLIGRAPMSGAVLADGDKAHCFEDCDTREDLGGRFVASVDVGFDFLNPARMKSGFWAPPISSRAMDGSVPPRDESMLKMIRVKGGQNGSPESVSYMA